MRKTTLLFFVSLFVLIGLFSTPKAAQAVTLRITWNGPVPYDSVNNPKVYFEGDDLTFSGRVIVSACADAIKIAKLEFYIGTKYLGRWYKGGGYARINSQYRKTFKIPGDISSGLVNVRVHYKLWYYYPRGRWYRGRREGDITKQIMIGQYNKAPQSAISCDPSDCSVYYGEPLLLLNESEDPDGDNDIVLSQWYIKLRGEPDTEYRLLSYCNWDYKGNCTPQSDVTPGAYTAKLYIEDSVGQASEIDATKDFTIKKDALAGFRCSLDNENWTVDCEALSPTIGNTLYLKDDPSLSEYSEASEGAVIIKRTWKVNGISFSSENDNNPSLTLVESSNVIELTIEDSAGREASAVHTIGASLPLPEWKETPP